MNPSWSPHHCCSPCCTGQPTASSSLGGDRLAFLLKACELSRLHAGNCVRQNTATGLFHSPTALPVHHYSLWKIEGHNHTASPSILSSWMQLRRQRMIPILNFLRTYERAIKDTKRLLRFERRNYVSRGGRMMRVIMTSECCVCYVSNHTDLHSGTKGVVL